MPPPTVLDDEEWYQVEQLLAHKKSRGQTRYLCRFTGYSEAYDQWLPEDSITEVAVAGYWETLKARTCGAGRPS